MQLHACLLLFIITTDKILALSHCGGHVSLEEPAGHMNLTLPGLTLTDPENAEETPPVSVCTWLIGIPLGRKVLLTPLWLESGSNVSVRCVWNEEHRFLESGGTVVLSHCDENKATLSWRGAGQSSHSIQLSYVQEDERNSSEDHSNTPHSDVVPWPKTGTSLTSTAPVGQEVVTGTDWGRSRLPEGLKEGTSEPRSMSSQGRGPLHSTSLPQTRTVTGKADRETLPLPEEEPNNRAEASGAAHLTDGPVSADERTRPYFQHAFATTTLFHTSQSTNTERFKFPQTQMPVKHAAASSSSTMPSTDTPENAVTQTSTLSIATQDYPVASSSSISTFTSSLPELPSWVTWKSVTTLSPHDGAVSQAPEENLPHSWRSQRSTDVADLTSAVTSEPLKTQTVPQKGDASNAHTNTAPTSSSSSYWKNPSRIHSSTTHISDLNSAVEASSFHANLSGTGSSPSGASDVTSQTSTLESSDQFENKEEFHAITFSTQSHTSSPQSTGLSTHSTLSFTTSAITQTSQEETRSPTHSTQRHLVHTHTTTDTISSLPDFTKADEWIMTGPPPTPSVPVTLGDVVQKSAATGTNTNTEPHTSGPTFTFLHDHSPTVSPAPHFPSTGSVHSSTPPYTSRVHTGFTTSPRVIHTSTPLPSATTEPTAHAPLIDHKTTPEPSETSSIKSTPSHTPHTQTNVPSPSPSSVPATHQKSKSVITTTHPSVTTALLEDEHKEVDKSDPSQENHTAPASSILTSVPSWRSTTSQMPKFYIVPDQPAAIRVESIELLLQIIVEEPTSGLQDDTAAWVEPYLQRAPGFSRMLGVWSSGHAVQSLVEFKTSEALQWLDKTGPASLLERTGLAQAVREGRSFRSSKITNITLGGIQADVCEWVLQCPAGHNCVSQPDASNYSCSSVCHFDYCHHHGICTHHPGQRPVCRCLVGEDFWYMGQRCDMRMTRARLVGACLAILLIIVTVIGVLAVLAVRRYRAILIQAKVDQTRSSYRRFNHFDELSGRFWLRSWAGSADSLDNPAFTRSDELLHLRALDRPCCYHDDTLSLASTCPSHGTRINTIYPHSSQYGWRGSEVSMGDGVLDSGKASDLSVCSWPVEPIHWTPFPLLQQLAAQRTPTVRVSRPRSYCEGMELVDLGKSWTA